MLSPGRDKGFEAFRQFGAVGCAEGYHRPIEHGGGATHDGRRCCHAVRAKFENLYVHQLQDPFTVLKHALGAAAGGAAAHHVNLQYRSLAHAVIFLSPGLEGGDCDH